VFKNRVITIFRSKTEEVTGGRGKQNKEEVHELCSSPNDIRAIKSMVIRCEGHISHLRELRNAYRNYQKT